ncbi:putative membrane protein, partial [Chlamydia psittaci 10_743_SC13]
MSVILLCFCLNTLLVLFYALYLICHGLFSFPLT